MLSTMSSKAVRLRLAEILRKRGLTQRQFSNRTGLSENAISKLSGQPRQIRLDTIATICETLDIEPGDLFERDRKAS